MSVHLVCVRNYIRIRLTRAVTKFAATTSTAIGISSSSSRWTPKTTSDSLDLDVLVRSSSSTRTQSHWKGFVEGAWNGIAGAKANRRGVKLSSALLRSRLVFVISVPIARSVTSSAGRLSVRLFVRHSVSQSLKEAGRQANRLSVRPSADTSHRASCRSSFLCNFAAASAAAAAVVPKAHLR